MVETALLIVTSRLNALNIQEAFVTHQGYTTRHPHGSILRTSHSSTAYNLHYMCQMHTETDVGARHRYYVNASPSLNVLLSAFPLLQHRAAQARKTEKTQEGGSTERKGKDFPSPPPPR